MRHGKAESHSQSGDDRDRELSIQGVTEILALGKVLKKMGATVEHIFTSPFVRTVQTGDLMAEGMRGPEPKATPELISGFAKVESLLAVLKTVPQARAVLMVAHMPEVGEIASKIMHYDLPLNMQPGSLCRLSFDGPPDLNTPAQLTLLLHAVDCAALVD